MDVGKGDTQLEATVDTQAPSPVERLGRLFAGPTGGGVLLIICTAIALAWANSLWNHTYFEIWEKPLTITFNDWGLSKDLHYWINDGLMAIFFFVVGLEIKRELMVGELSSIKQAALPIAGALGGVMVPALIYTILNAGTPGAAGWGVPMATDIAFAVGIMALLGDRVPFGIKVFVTALAIVDDLVAVLVIAVFYTAHLNWAALGFGALCMVILCVMNRLGVRHPVYYALLGIALWWAFLSSGVHATIAGVLLAITIPSSTHIDAPEFLSTTRRELEHFKRGLGDSQFITSEDQRAAVHAIEVACDRVQPPLHRMEHSLQPWVAYLIMPVFALSNAGLSLGNSTGFQHPVTLGVILGLLLGKPIGIFLASLLTVKLGYATLPAGVGWKHIHGAGWLCGIGFTMSLFIAGLAFEDASALDEAKLGILTASLLAAIIGSTFLALASVKRH
jgi:Na+:H+ antiporter, NhaA family